MGPWGDPRGRVRLSMGAGRGRIDKGPRDAVKKNGTRRGGIGTLQRS